MHADSRTHTHDGILDDVALIRIQFRGDRGKMRSHATITKTTINDADVTAPVAQDSYLNMVVYDLLSCHKLWTCLLRIEKPP
jgi:hypothetical protein